MAPRPPDPWPRRVRHAVPRIPDWLWACGLGVMLVTWGVILGLTWRLADRATLQHQLDRLEQRVRTLEQRLP